MAFTANYEHTYDFRVTGSTYVEVEQAAVKEAKRYYGEDADFTIIKMFVEPSSYTYSYSGEIGTHQRPKPPMVADVFTRMREPLEGGNTRANRRRTRDVGAGGRLED